MHLLHSPFSENNFVYTLQKHNFSQFLQYKNTLVYNIFLSNIDFFVLITTWLSVDIHHISAGHALGPHALERWRGGGRV